MRKFIKLFLGSLFAGSVFIFSVIHILDQSLFKNSESLPFQKINKFYSPENEFKLAILGSSKAEGNYIPSILGSAAKTQNFGLPGTGNKIWYHMLSDELQNTFKRKIIVNIDLTRKPIKRGKDFNYTYYLKLPKNTELYKALEDSTKAELLPSPLFYFGSIKGFISESLKDHLNFETISEQGFKGKTKSLNDKQFESHLENINFIEVEFDESIWTETLKKIRNSDDTIYFVLAPVYKEKVQNLNYTKFKTELEQLVKSCQNAYFYDFSSSVNDKNLFYDPNHLNYNGAVKFSKMLKDSILD